MQSVSSNIITILHWPHFKCLVPNTRSTCGENWGQRLAAAQPLSDDILELCRPLPHEFSFEEVQFTHACLGGAQEISLLSSLMSWAEQMNILSITEYPIYQSLWKTDNVSSWRPKSSELLAESNGPTFIEYFSLDTEGSGKELLESFPFGGTHLAQLPWSTIPKNPRGARIVRFWEETDIVCTKVWN